MARGAFPDDHPLCLGMPGMHGNYTAVTVDAEGRPADRARVRASTTASPARSTAFAPDAKIIHVDIDPAELGKVRRPDVPIVGDCRLVIEELIKAVKAEQAKHERARRSRVASRSCASGRSDYPLKYEQEEDGPLKPQFVHRAAARQHARRLASSCRASASTRCGRASCWKFNHPYTWVNSGGLGTMGYAVPAAIGAKVGRPDRMVWAIDGDGCFQMTAQELVTASAERIPVKIAILNNAYLGMVRQWQELFYEERYSEVYLSPDLPDYVKWAEAMGCVGMRVDNADDVVRHDREGERDRRPSGRDRLPHRLAREGVPDGRRRARRTTTSSSAPSSARADGDDGDRRPAPHPHRHVENKPGVLSRVAGLFSRRGVQHRVARGQPDRRRALLAA